MVLSEQACQVCTGFQWRKYLNGVKSERVWAIGITCFAVTECCLLITICIRWCKCYSEEIHQVKWTNSVSPQLEFISDGESIKSVQSRFLNISFWSISKTTVCCSQGGVNVVFQLGVWRYSFHLNVTFAIACDKTGQFHYLFNIDCTSIDDCENFRQKSMAKMATTPPKQTLFRVSLQVKFVYPVIYQKC